MLSQNLESFLSLSLSLSLSLFNFSLFKGRENFDSNIEGISSYKVTGCRSAKTINLVYLLIPNLLQSKCLELFHFIVSELNI